MEVAPDKSWFFRNVEEEGVFVKIDEFRFSTKLGFMTENVIDVNALAKKKKKDQYICVSKNYSCYSIAVIL